MPRLRYDHISAITRSQSLLETAVDVRGNKRLSAQIRRDIVLLCQLREILYFALENPTLPFDPPYTVTKTSPVPIDEEPS